MDFYQGYYDKYQKRLIEVGYKIVEVGGISTELYPTLTIMSLDDVEEYTVGATDTMVNCFIEDMRRRRNEHIANMLAYMWADMLGMSDGNREFTIGGTDMGFIEAYNHERRLYTKYNTWLNAIGYKLDGVKKSPMSTIPKLMISDLKGIEKYEIEALPAIMDRFLKDREKEKLISMHGVSSAVRPWLRVSDELAPRCIQRRGTATIVRWKDGTETKIVRQAGTEDAGLFAAFCMSLGKKIFGTTKNLERVILEADEERQNAFIAEAKLAVKKQHAEQMERQRKRALKRQRRLERRRMNREQMEIQAQALENRKVGVGNDDK